MQDIDLIELLIAMILSAIGGVVRKLSELEHSPDKEVTLRQYIFASIISCFVGIVIYSILKHYDWPMLLIMAIVSIAGFTGSPVMHLLSLLFMNRLKKEAGDSKSGGDNEKD